jgi:two-component system, chemotaxis family, protein-glutamate methylesterase/glutaminase
VINEARIPRDLIVIGASAGGVLAIAELLARLPSDLGATVGVVLHRSPFHETRLPQVLGRHSDLLVTEPLDGDHIERGTVYVAPRDQHMLIDGDVIRLDRGPKQHRTRPAVDPLFTSAAASHGRHVVGVILSGMGSDGVGGLIAIKATGGVSLVQSPAEAEFPVMPSRALKDDHVDGSLPIAGIAEALIVLAAGGVVADGASSTRAGAPG